MRILAIEFSSWERSVAALDTATGQVGSASHAKGRSTPAFDLIQGALTRAGLDRSAIDCVAVGLGPGSFTGIRNAIALAQGWQLARDVRLAGYSSMDCLAFGLAAAGRTGRFRLVVDAQRGEFYANGWELGPSGPRETDPPRIIAAEALIGALGPEEILAGPDAFRLADGPGLAGRVEEAFPDARILARLAATRPESVSGETLQPIYLRPVTFQKAGAAGNPSEARRQE